VVVQPLLNFEVRRLKSLHFEAIADTSSVRLVRLSESLLFARQWIFGNVRSKPRSTRHLHRA